MILALLISLAIVASSVATNPQCLNDGTVVGGQCKCKPGYAGKLCGIKVRCCLIYGDPHYLTYDGARIDFQGSCKYSASHICNCLPQHSLMSTLPKFDVSVENWRKGKKDSRVSYTKTVSVRTANHTVTLGQEMAVTVNGEDVSVPYKAIPGVEIKNNGEQVKLSLTEGASVSFDGRSSLIICIPEIWAGIMCGICGNNNKNKRDDYVTRDGTDLLTLKDSRSIMIGNSWRDPDFKKDSCKEEVVEPKFRPSEKWIKMAESHEYCGLIVDREGPFGKCINRFGNDKTMAIYETCLEDVYANQPDSKAAHKMACDTLETLKKSCQEEGAAPPKTWFDLSKCQAPCVSPTHFRSNTTGCPATCSDPDAPSTCTEPNTDGCVCNDGFILSNNQCVKTWQCGCTDEQGTYHKTGSAWFDDACTKKFRCKFVKGKKTPQIVAASPCRPHEYCKAVAGVMTCLKKPVPGGWSKWSEWSDCEKSEAEGGLVRMRIRSCTKPAPKYGGKCEGDAYETKLCV